MNISRLTGMITSMSIARPIAERESLIHGQQQNQDGSYKPRELVRLFHLENIFMQAQAPLCTWTRKVQQSHLNMDSTVAAARHTTHAVQRLYYCGLQ